MVLMLLVLGRADGPVVWEHDAARGLWVANQLIL